MPTCLRIINYFGGIAVYRKIRPEIQGHSHCVLTIPEIQPKFIITSHHIETTDAGLEIELLVVKLLNVNLLLIFFCEQQAFIKREIHLFVMKTHLVIRLNLISASPPQQLFILFTDT